MSRSRRGSAASPAAGGDAEGVEGPPRGLSERRAPAGSGSRDNRIYGTGAFVMLCTTICAPDFGEAATSVPFTST